MEHIDLAHIYGSVVFTSDLRNRMGKPLYDFSGKTPYETIMRGQGESIETFEERVNARCRKLNAARV